MKQIRIAIAALFIMMVLLAPSMVALAASCGETVSQDTTAALQAVDYENNEIIGKLLAPSRYSLTDKLSKKTEIALREGKSPADISDEQAIRELNQDNIKVMSFEEAFADVQAEIGEIIQKVVDSTAGAEQKGAAFFTDKILQNKEKLLIGLTYLERLYDFDMGGHNIKDVLLYKSKPYMYGKIENVLDWLIYIGGIGGDTLKVSNNANVFGYNKIFWPVTSAATLEEFMEENRQKWMPDTPMNEWFLQESPAYILEESSVWNGTDTGLYNRLYGDAISRAYILPLLTVSEDSIYVIANPATITYGIVDCYIDRNLKESDPARYGELREKFLQQLEQAAKQQKAFIDCWYRIATPEKKGLLASNRVVLDSLRIDPDTIVQWSDKFGKNAALGVREFFTPLNLYGAYMFADGVAEGTRIRYYVSKALTERGYATYAHELTHMLVSEIMLNGYGSRDGMLAEVYTRGMFEPYELNDPPAFNLNLIYDRQAVSDRYHNGLPERFQDESDLQSYMSGILDVIYTLDYAEADVMLTKSAEEKMKWFHKLEQIEDPDKRVNQGEEGSKHYLDSVRELTLDEAKELNTIEDLIRDSIIVSRYEVDGTKTTGTLARNGYYVVPLFSANYAGVQNDYGVSGDVMIRRQAFELLAEYGYYGGMVPYISNQYKESAKSDQTILSDQYILNHIFDGAYETMAEFKNAMFQKRIEKIDKLKPVTITWKDQPVVINNPEKLRLLMKEAVESDLIKVNVLPGGYNNLRAHETEVERLKQEIFKAYLIQTGDFSESVYGAGPSPVDPPGTVTPGEPDTEEPETEEPGTEEPGTEEPGTEEPGTEEPGTEEPGTEEPGTEEPGTEEPGTEEPGTEEPGTEEPGTEEPGTEEPGTEEPGTEEPGTEEPGTEEPGTEEPGTEEPGTEEPGTEQPEEPGTQKPEEPKEPGAEKPGNTGSEQPEKPGNTETEQPQAPDTETSKEDKAPKLLLCKVSSANTSHTIRWSTVKAADGYEIYGAKSNGKYKRLQTVSKKSDKWKHKKLKKGKQYKYYVKAYQKIDGKRVVLAQSPPVYSTTKGGKYGNPSKIEVTKTRVSVKSGKRVRLRVKVTGKKIRNAGKKVRYISSNPSVAKVSNNGVITGKKRGSCTIYCITQNGLYKKVKVKVNSK
ncbi:MAG: hypothetical protein HFJ04_09520 [Lachnospiraceae bacterium]|nr:hypothetical protein [Lachnospiraceae bacterium]